MEVGGPPQSYPILIARDARHGGVFQNAAKVWVVRWVLADRHGLLLTTSVGMAVRRGGEWPAAVAQLVWLEADVRALVVDGVREVFHDGIPVGSMIRVSGEKAEHTFPPV